MNFGPGWTRAHDVASAALALAMVACVVGVTRAVLLEPLPTRAPAAHVASMPGPAPRAATLSDDAVIAAIERDMFASEVAGDVEDGAAWSDDEWDDAEVVAPTSPAPLRLTGVMLLPGGGVASLSVDGGPAQLVRVGEQFGGRRLLRVAPGLAVLAGSGDTLELRLATPPAPRLLAGRDQP